MEDAENCKKVKMTCKTISFVLFFLWLHGFNSETVNKKRVY